MSKRRDQDFLSDICEAIQRIAVYTEGMTIRRFMKDIKTQDAVVHNREVIGEATKNLSSRLRRAYPKIPWKDLAGVRDKMIHHCSCRTFTRCFAASSPSGCLCISWSNG
jgi:uncharacterized protein with HEPN domain